MRFTRRRSDRIARTRQRSWTGSILESLERRELMTLPGGPLYHPGELPPRTVSHLRGATVVPERLYNSDRQLTFLDNDGKILQGTDRDGDQWVITVHGPGAVIVNDVTPNDGVLDDEIDTIQLVGTNPTSTFVTGQVTGSALQRTDGIIRFSKLLVPSGANSVILNGFTLARTVPSAGVSGTPNDYEVFIPGGIHYLSFHNIEVENNTDDIQPIDLVIGDPTTPLRRGVRPTIKLDSIFNTVADALPIPPGVPSTDVATPTPQTVPSVNIVVNGQIKTLDFVSTTAAPITPAGLQPYYPQVGITGRTAVQAEAIDKVRVAGAARNLTASRTQPPFQNGFSGLAHLNRADFLGQTDGVGLDVSGPIGTLNYAKGMGDNVGVQPAATNWGIPRYQFGYAANGYLGGQVKARSIKSLNVGAANTVLQETQVPPLIQELRQNYNRWFTRPGIAMASAVVTTTGSIDNLHVVGDSFQSNVHTGFDYNSFQAGLEPTRGASKVDNYHQKGDLVDTVVSASWRPVDDTFGNGNDIRGNGTINGTLQGGRYNGGKTTALSYAGNGVYANTKTGKTPPPDHTFRFKGVLTR